MRIIDFPTVVGGKAVEQASPKVRMKLGLYPLGTADVVMSVDLFNTIVAVFERGTAAERLLMSVKLAEAYKMTFVEVE